MSRIKIFKTCNIKNSELEKYLAGGDEKNIIRDKIYTANEFDKILGIPTRNDILLLKIYPHPHSLILVKNKFLEKGYSIFDSNGYVAGPREAPYVFIENIPFYVVSKDDTDELLDEVSPERPLNRGNDTVNPGYCGIFGIIFMVYFKQMSKIEGWNKSWLEFVNKAREPFELRNDSDSPALRLAADVQEIIKNNSNNAHMEQQIFQRIIEYFNKVNIKFPQLSKKRQRTDFGKSKYFYNGKTYNIIVGPRGGKYILVRTIKKYIK